jgi:hypothetical protein
MNARILLACVLAVAPARGAALRTDAAVDAITGTWRGSSLCVNRQALPACGDEQVVYNIAATAGKPHAVTVTADKIVDGQRVPMGVLEFTHDAATGRWTTDIETPRTHARLQLDVLGAAIKGTMTLVPSGTVVRQIALTREK